MGNFIKIIYSRAHDGLADKKGKPNSFAHLATILVMSDAGAPGMLSLLSPIIRSVAKRAKKNGTEKWVLDNYCCMGIKAFRFHAFTGGKRKGSRQ